MLGAWGTSQTLVRAARAFPGHTAGTHPGSGVHCDDCSWPESELAPAMANSCSCAGSAGARGAVGREAQAYGCRKKGQASLQREVLCDDQGKNAGQLPVSDWAQPPCKHPRILHAQSPRPPTCGPPRLHGPSESPPGSWGPSPWPCSGAVRLLTDPVNPAGLPQPLDDSQSSRAARVAGTGTWVLSPPGWGSGSGLLLMLPLPIGVNSAALSPLHLRPLPLKWETLPALGPVGGVAERWGGKRDTEPEQPLGVGEALTPGSSLLPSTLCPERHTRQRRAWRTVGMQQCFSVLHTHKSVHAQRHGPSGSDAHTNPVWLEPRCQLP